MTDATRNKIESESIFAVENLFAKTVTYPESYCDLYQQGCAYGYNLAAQELVQKQAIAFAEWVDNRATRNDRSGLWIHSIKDAPDHPLSSKELYAIFLEHQTKQS